MKNELAICSKRVENDMKQPTPARIGNTFSRGTACLFSFSIDAKIYASSNNAEMAAGYWFALSRACVLHTSARKGVQMNKRTMEQTVVLAGLHITHRASHKCQICKWGLGALKRKSAVGVLDSSDETVTV